MSKKTTTILAAILGGAMGTVAGYKMRDNISEQSSGKIEKFRSYYNVLNQWLLIKNEGHRLDKYFKEKGYHNIAVYGMGELGSRLYEELQDTDVKVNYGIDRYAGSVFSELDVYSLDDELPEADVIVVTAVFDYENIEKKLSDITDIPVVSLEEIVYEL